MTPGDAASPSRLMHVAPTVPTGYLRCMTCYRTWLPGPQATCDICRFYNVTVDHSRHVRCPTCWEKEIRPHQETARQATALREKEKPSKKKGNGTKAASRRSKCKKCEEPIAPGDPIAKTFDGKWVHLTCPTMTKEEIDFEQKNLHDDPTVDEDQGHMDEPSPTSPNGEGPVERRRSDT